MSESTTKLRDRINTAILTTIDHDGLTVEQALGVLEAVKLDAYMSMMERDEA